MGQYFNVATMDSDGKVTSYNRRVNGEYTMAKLTEHSWWYNEFVGTMTKKLHRKPTRIAWVGDYSEGEEIVKENHLYELAFSEDEQGVEKDILLLDGKYLVNHSKKLYLDCNAYRERSNEDEDWCMHPLPLLTAAGNGLGGGDYYGINKEDVGKWCWDLISVEDEPPEGYEEAEYTFIDAH